EAVHRHSPRSSPVLVLLRRRSGVRGRSFCRTMVESRPFFMYKRHLICIALAALTTLVSCSRDPNYLKQKYLDSGNKYYDQKRYKEASLMYRKAIEKDRKFGPAYYHLALVDLKMEQVANAYNALRRAYETLPKKGADYNDTSLKLAEIILMSASSQADPQPMLKDVQPMVDALLKANSNSWEGHKLNGDIALLQATAAYRNNNGTEAKTQITTAIQEYRTSLAAKPGDYIITLALGR